MRRGRPMRLGPGSRIGVPRRGCQRPALPTFRRAANVSISPTRTVKIDAVFGRFDIVPTQPARLRARPRSWVSRARRSRATAAATSRSSFTACRTSPSAEISRHEARREGLRRRRSSRRVAVKVAVLTTSYPRFPGDAAGRFVADAVEHVRARGVDVEVVGPEQFRHFGIAYGHGVVGNLRRRPWLALLVPALLASFVRAARRVDADLLHAHWLPAGWVAARTRQAVRRPGVGDGRRACAARAVACAPRSARRAARDRRVDGARRARARCSARGRCG